MRSSDCFGLFHLSFIGLPRYPGNSHVSTLQAFHKVIELYESAKVLKDLSADPRTRLAKLSDLRQNLQARPSYCFKCLLMRLDVAASHAK